MLRDGYMWIVTDGVVGNQDQLTMGKSTYKEWNGIIGTLPSYKNENPDPEKDKFELFSLELDATFCLHCFSLTFSALYVTSFELTVHDCNLSRNYTNVFELP